MEPVPADVLISRAVRGHTRALLALVVACLVLALIAIGALALAGADRATAPITAGLSLLGVGQLGALATAAIAGVGLVRVLRGVGEPGSSDSAAAAQADLPRRVTRATASRFALSMRLIVGACILMIAVWALANPAGIVGAVIGALVTVQLVVALALLRVHLLRAL